MATLEILTPEVVLVGSTLRVVAFVKNNLGAPVDTSTLTYALFDLTTNRWWDATDEAWEVNRVENAMALLDPAGIYSADVDVVTANPATLAKEWLVFVTCDNPALQSARGLSLRHSLMTQPVADAAIPADVSTLSDLLTLLRATFSHDQIVDDTTKRLIIYQADGVTPAIQFNLKDAAGTATTREPFQLIRV